jgi:hypothetical protein
MEQLSRRALLRVGAAAATLVGLGAMAGCGARTDNSRGQTPATAADGAFPRMTILSSLPGVAAGNLYYTYNPQAGRAGVDDAVSQAAAITDPAGAPLWTTTGQGSYGNFRVQRYQGSPVLTYWDGMGGPQNGGTGAGRDVLTDLQHRTLAVIEHSGEYYPDVHEFFITPWNTGLITSYRTVSADLSSVGGQSRGRVWDANWEEVDIQTGKILFRWSALDHIPLSESYQPVPRDPSSGYDYAHINAVTTTPDGNILVSSRHTWTIYKIDRGTGAIIWRLGGKSSDFPIPAGASFAWQHHALYEDDTTVRLFDNGTDGVTVEHPTRALWLTLRESAHTVELKQSLAHPKKVTTSSMGSVERLPNGNVLIGWGSAARVSEFSAAGELLFDARLPSPSYRTFRFAPGQTSI